MKTTIVKPANTQFELLFVLLVTIVVITVSGTAVGLRLRSKEGNRLLAHQISAFENLNTKEMGIFNDLYTAAIEINDIHTSEEELWISVRDLDQEFIPPFVHDLAWEMRGKMFWNMEILDNKTKHTVMYLGNSAENKKIGSFLLICLHEHKNVMIQSGIKHALFEIWYHIKQNIGFPIVFNDQALITNGWKEVLAYKGEDEVIRLRGKEYL